MKYAIVYELSQKMEDGDNFEVVQKKMYTVLTIFGFEYYCSNVYIQEKTNNNLVQIYRCMRYLNQISYKKYIRKISVIQIYDESDFTEIVKSYIYK